MNEELLNGILRSPRLPTPPSVAIQVIDLVQDPSVSTVALASTIGADPALTARVLRTANSSFYAQARTIKTVNDAIVLLGLNNVRTLALGFSLVDTFRANQSGLFDFDTFWRRSVTAASAARAIAALSSTTRKEEAFLAGLMLKIGVLALNSALGDRYATSSASPATTTTASSRSSASASTSTTPPWAPRSPRSCTCPRSSRTPSACTQRPTSPPSRARGLSA